MRLSVGGQVVAVLTVATLGACGGTIEGHGGGSSSGADGGGSSSSSGGGSSSGADAGGSSSGSGGGSSSGADGGRVPVNHRPSDAQCSAPAPAGDCAGPGPTPGGCTSDSACSDGTNGRCINPGGGPAADCFCTYDACADDNGCPTGQTCACHGAPYTDSADNKCVAGNCRVDADCGTGGYCSPSELPAVCGDSLAGYYCHTAGDRCVDDTDCGQGQPNGACEYSTTDSRWECHQVLVCG